MNFNIPFLSLLGEFSVRGSSGVFSSAVRQISVMYDHINSPMDLQNYILCKNNWCGLEILGGWKRRNYLKLYMDRFQEEGEERKNEVKHPRKIITV